MTNPTVCSNLQRERPRVVVVLAMNQKHRGRDFVGVHERRHLHISVRRLPDRTLLGLMIPRTQAPSISPQDAKPDDDLVRRIAPALSFSILLLRATCSIPRLP